METSPIAFTNATGDVSLVRYILVAVKLHLVFSSYHQSLSLPLSVFPQAGIGNLKGRLAYRFIERSVLAYNRQQA